MSREIKLTKGKVAIVDDVDYEWLNQWKWCTNNAGRKTGGYATRGQWDKSSKRTGTILMHRQILNAPKGTRIDHINRNSLDNRRENLRITTYSIDAANRERYKNNTSGFKGVALHKESGRWKMYISRFFDTPEEAARAYDKCTRLLSGKHVYLNFPDD